MLCTYIIMLDIVALEIEGNLRPSKAFASRAAYTKVKIYQ